MSARQPAHLAAAWAVAFALPHVYWATGRTEGLRTALSDDVVRDGGAGLAVGCGAIAVFCLCGAAVALASVHGRFGDRATTRRLLVASVWFGALLLVARTVDIYVEFSLALTDVRPIPAADRSNYLHLARWFMFGYGPWFALGAVAWTSLARRITPARRRAGKVGERPAAGAASARR